MSKLTRKNIKVFGGSSSNTGKFGSAAAGSGVLTSDIETIQSLAAWDNGMASATIGGQKLLPQEEMEAMMRVATYGVANIYQDGIPVYDSLTTYYTGSIVRQDNTTILYKSLTDNNVGNVLTDNTKWENIGDLSNLINAGSNYSADTSNMPILANNATNPNTQIDFSSGFCYDLSTLVKITNTALTKKLDAGFATGNGNGGLDTGANANSTWYHCFAISKADGTSDFLFSLSATAPTMPSGFVNKRRIGSVKTDSSGNIIQFVQLDDKFFYKTPIADLTTSVAQATYANLTISTPYGIITEALLTCELGGDDTFIYIANANYSTMIEYRFVGSVSIMTVLDMVFPMSMLTTSTSQILYKIWGNSITNVILNTRGYIDKRGKN
jgi:hypothetical protein